MTEKCQKKNYYFLKTILSEIHSYDTVSFNVFDTLIFRNVLYPSDIFKYCATHAENKYGIKNFNLIRSNTETKLRTAKFRENKLIENITLDEIYNIIDSEHSGFPTDDLKELELEYEKKLITPNPIAKEIFNAANTLGKRIILIAESCLPSSFILELLSQCGYEGEFELFASGEIHKTKTSGNLYRFISEKNSLDYSKWIHIGADIRSDITVPRSFGITSAFLRCPRDWFFIERETMHKLAELKAGEPLPLLPLDESTDFSTNTAIDINSRFTKTVAPNSEIAIKATDVSMMFNMAKEKTDNLKEYFIKFIKRQLSFKEFWALKNVSFEIRKGEKLGLIGVNGSGKSTMLKCVSGVLTPTNGSVYVNGTIAPMIELGAGFDPNLSARENVYLNGAILGYNRKQMDEYYDSIIEFAELKDFQDVAIKNFSSGMIARLGFAIATCNVPDILIIDEILAVGDFEFRKKCHKKMEELTGKGATVLFVSHSASDIISMCDRALWLDHGNLVAEGEAQYIVEKYLG